MTVRGEACMEDSQSSSASQSSAACNGHRHHHHYNHHHQAGRRHSKTEHEKGPGSSTKHSSASLCSRGFQSISEVSEPDDAFSRSEESRTTETDDELPLGSEANSLRQAAGDTGDGVGVQPPVDKRLLWLRQGGGALPNSGWTSFNSDASNLTSGSSANSVDWLLQERQVDPEEVLRNLGFGGGAVGHTVMYSRIPARFFQQPAQEAARLDDGEAAAQEAGGDGDRRNPSRATAAWRTARTVSSAMFSLKVLSSLQQTSPLSMLGAGSVHGRSPLSGSSPSLTPPGNPRSVLHPDNQRFLARQGFYGDNLPEGIDPELVQRSYRREDEDDVRTRHSAQDKRKMFHKTRSKRQRSLVESGGDEDMESRDSIMKSMEFSTTTESTDSGELMSSAPTTPGDVFTERVPSPLPGGPVFPISPVANIEDLYFPERGGEQQTSKFTDCRKKLTDKLMADLDNDDHYFVSPPTSRQHTVEKSVTLTEAQPHNLEQEVDNEELSASHRSVQSDLNGKSVTIVVSSDGRARKVSPTNTFGGCGGGGMNFLSIVNAAVDRLSDSGSEHTLVDHQSSTSSSESPQPGNANGSQEQKENEHESCDGFTDLERGPMFHKRGQGSPRDENDNFTDTRQPQNSKLPHHHVSSQFLDDELPRMSSIQSDSSGFGDAEVSGDNAQQEMASLKVSSLGSSCDSSVTQASTCTITPNNGGSSHQHDLITPTTSFNLQESDVNQQLDSWMAPTRESAPSSSETGSGRRFVSWCYIPVNSKNTRSSSTSPCKQPPRPTTSPKDFVLGKTRISLVVQEKNLQQTDSDLRRGGQRTGVVVVSNERPLSEELAMVRMQGDPQSSTPRYPTGQAAVSAVPRLILQQSTIDTSGQDGTRSTVDELDDERGSIYSPWGKDMMHGGARQRFIPSPGEEGDVGSGASVEESSVYSCASTTDSITSSTNSEILDCHKLIKLINQPTLFKGQKTQLVHYRPKCHLHEWPGLVKKKKLQEETRLAQYAVQKFKTELSIMETSVMVKYQLVFEDMTQEERDDVEELQHLWAEVRRQVTDTEQLLTSRMKAIASSNDSFNSLASISVLQRMIDILKEQMFQKQICTQDEQEEQEEMWMEKRRVDMFQHPAYSPRYMSSSWTEFPWSPVVRGRYSSSTSHLHMMSPSYQESSFEQLRHSLLSDVHREVRSSLKTLHDDLQKRDDEIQHLQQQLLEQRTRRPRATGPRSKSHHSSRYQNGNRKETDV